MLRVSTLVLFLILEEMLSIFHHWGNVCCGFVIYSFYYAEVCSFYSYFLESFCHKWILNFIKRFFCIYRDDHTVLFFNLFIWLCQILVAAHGIFNCGIQTLGCSMWDLVARPGIKPKPLHWERGVLANGPLEKSWSCRFKFLSLMKYRLSVFPFMDCAFAVISKKALQWLPWQSSG